MLEPEPRGTPYPATGAEPLTFGGEKGRWGEPPAPLLPESLRRVLAGELLPGWLIKDLALSADATTIALDGSLWKGVHDIPSRVKEYLIRLVAYRVREIADTVVLGDGWNGGNPQLVEWPTRARNALERNGLLTADRLARLRYGELFAVPGLGAKSVLEFAIIAERAAAPRGQALTDDQREELIGAPNEPWAERLRADDVRLPRHHAGLRGHARSVV